jgi:hypothetical protein
VWVNIVLDVEDAGCAVSVVVVNDPVLSDVPISPSDHDEEKLVVRFDVMVTVLAIDVWEVVRVSELANDVPLDEVRL